MTPSLLHRLRRDLRRLDLGSELEGLLRWFVPFSLVSLVILSAYLGYRLALLLAR